MDIQADKRLFLSDKRSLTCVSVGVGLMHRINHPHFMTGVDGAGFLGPSMMYPLNFGELYNYCLGCCSSVGRATDS